MKKDLDDYLYVLTKQIFKIPNECFSANSIANGLGLNRSTVSNYLNEAFRDKEVIKVKEYPVLFLHVQALVDMDYPLNKLSYESMKEVGKEDTNTLGSVIGFNGSLKEAINQIKTAVLYPDNGLPILIIGSSGSGKTFLANKIHSFAVESGVLDKNSPFISYNCAQYYNNPELLSSALFGHTQGAFTGADSDHTGLIEKADGGILFLDEVHRLSNEGQEKLFTFMDTGCFSPMGDSSVKKYSTVRLVFATTENINSAFLPTFLRRLPVTVTLPKFQSRPQSERLQLIDSFFINESRILNKRLEVSHRLINFLLDVDLEGNVGKIKNIIKYTCGNAYINKGLKKEEITIRLSDLPTEYSIRFKDSFNKIQKKNTNRSYCPDDTQRIELEGTEIRKIRTFFYDMIIEFKKTQQYKENSQLFIDNFSNRVVQLLDEFIFKELYNKEESFYSVLTYQIRKTLEFMYESFNFEQDGNQIISLASYLYIKDSTNILDGDTEWDAYRNEIDLFFKTYLEHQYFYAKKIIGYLSKQLDQPVFLEDILFVTLYLHSLNIQDIPNSVKCVILAHGYSTASSMANVANRMLGKNIFQSYDMPINISLDKIESEVIRYINNYKTDEGLILLVDMGSLNQLGEKLARHAVSPLIIFDNVSTPLVLEVGNHVIKGATITEIYDVININNRIEKQLILPKKKKKKAIITCCYTGMGNARKIQDILDHSLASVEYEIIIIPYDYKKLFRNKLYEAPFQIYDVLVIIGTENPKINQIPYIGMEELISGSSVDKLVDILKGSYDVDQSQLKNDLLFNFSINKIVENLTILDPKKILNLVQKAIKNLEKIKNVSLSNNKLFVLYIHCCSMIERILRKEVLDEQEDLQIYITKEKYNLNILSNVFKEIEDEYNIKIPINEFRVINDILEG